MYDEKTVKHVIFIAMSRDMGFSLPFIAEYLPRFKAGKLSAQDMIEAILARVAEFKRWCGIEVTVAEPGFVEIQMPWRPEVGQYSGYLHAGLMGTLIDTAQREIVSVTRRGTKVHCAGPRGQTRQRAGLHQL